MSMGGEVVRDQETEDFCKKIAKKIRKYKTRPDVVKALKELGREVLKEYKATPGVISDLHDWFKKYEKLFCV